MTPTRIILALACLMPLAAPQALSPGERSRALHDPHDSLWAEPAPGVYRVRIETTKGVIVLEATRSLAPLGADRFYHLVQVGFYDDSRFYRVISGRFAQFGISGEPTIGKIWQNDRIPDDPVKASNVRGTFAFAMTGPDARTTQIYINTGDQSRLDAMGFAPFGKVVKGMNVVDSLYTGYGEASGGGMRAGHQDKLFEKAMRISTATSLFWISSSAQKSLSRRNDDLAQPAPGGSLATAAITPCEDSQYVGKALRQAAASFSHRSL